MKLTMSILNNDKYEAISGAITNQFFTKLSFMSNCILILCGINPFSNLSGKVVGPALNFFPKKEGAIYEEIQWMPTCVAAYIKPLLLLNHVAFLVILKDIVLEKIYFFHYHSHKTNQYYYHEKPNYSITTQVVDLKKT